MNGQGLDSIPGEGCGAAKIGREKEKAVKNSYLSEGFSTLARAIWARSRRDWPERPGKGVQYPRRYATSSAVLYCFPGISEPTQFHTGIELKSYQEAGAPGKPFPPCAEKPFRTT